MCRFIAYLGKTPVILNEILDAPENSLINQSRQAREGKLGLNADGFGIGWYDHAIDSEPGIFKSIQPAWNDHNLRHVAAKVRSTCFLGHVRASTIGDVNTFNCHPFSYKQFLFVHNGTIRGIEKIKRRLLGSLTDKSFNFIKGQTDSELFFAMLMDILYQNTQSFKLDSLYDAMLLSIKKINAMQRNLDAKYFSRLNTVLTDGKQLIATRYVSDEKEEALSLYYTIGDYVDTNNGGGLMHQVEKSPGAILIASEPLTDYAKEWQEVPANHVIMVSEQLKLSIKPIET